MNATVRRIAFVCVTALSCAALGCSGKAGDTGNTGDPKMASYLRELGVAWHTYNSQSPKAPTNVDDVKKFLKPDIADAVVTKINSGEIVVIWGVSTGEMAASGGLGNAVLAYEKDAPTKGGQVLMGDAAVKKVTAEEFKTLKLAKKADK